LGAKPHSLLPLWYSAADIVVLPSWYESYGLVALEAMASGACVIASSAGGLPYLIEDRQTGFLFPPGNISKLSAIMAHLLENATEVTRVGSAASRFARRQTWHRQAREVLGVYQNVLEQHTT